jgi:hypothetical protein
MAIKTTIALAVLAAATGYVAAEAPLCLYIYQDGTGAIQNDGVEPIMFDGYTILSADGTLGADVLGINDNSWLDFGFPAMLGLTMQEATSFQELSATPYNYSEVTLTPDLVATLQAGDSIHLGQNFVWTSACADYTFTFVDSTAGGGTGDLIGSHVICVPEPATMSLLGLGAAALLRRRSR